jgi:coproporphyrinogen III oxidase
MSLPSEVRWSYDYQIAPDSEEAILARDYLPAQDWLE